MLDATLLATDLSENITRWTYTDPRLSPLLDGQQLSATRQWRAGWDMGTSARATRTAQSLPLAERRTPTQGPTLRWARRTRACPPTSTGTARRTSPATGTSTPSMPRAAVPRAGKLVQIIVRWNEPQVGWHQVVVTTFKRNPANLF